MYAIVEIAGQQFKVAKDQKVYVQRLQKEEGAKVSFDKVLLLDSKGTVTVGAPAIKGAEVTAKILGHLKGDKVIVFKKKRRKGYRKKNGHRQALTEIQIESIIASGAKKKEVANKEPVKKEESKVEVAKKESKVTTSDDLSSKTVAELKALAKEKGITGYTSLKKAELIEALTK
ncbi:50S ribosomal protein L21 [Lutibacter sp.]|uniref:50S ribosomal protein L21 n=1 Tax=Lutibacter sp. TaxID=1925666 RepID=UPI0025BA6B12|nr:50S ribosomal protein L21 [Lutibacter sp.]MCF6167723.1 50S ribosomal protein L21 [Lutibacter sp.]